MFKKEFNHILRQCTDDAIMSENDTAVSKRNNKTKENNSGSKRDNRKHLYHFVARVFKCGVEYVQFETKDGTGYCPIANIESIKNQFDESLTLANI